MEYKTILEWFESAKEDGCEWAEEAISETLRLRGELRLQQLEMDLENALLSAFNWYESINGAEYWRDIKRGVCID